MTALFDAAVGYARRQLFVFPCYEITPAGDCACPLWHPSRGPTGRCRNPGKHPRTRNGFKDATIDHVVIKQWCGKWSHANIGIDCGRSGLVVIDIDPRNGGDITLADLERRHGALPDTPRQLSGGGGAHHVLKRPDWPHVRSPEHGLGCGIDLKCDGGYILVAPSNHVSGGRYHWEIGYGLDDLPLAAPPAWILRALEQHRNGGAGRLQADGAPLELREGERNRRLFQIGCALRRYGANERALFTCLDAINREHARPPLPENELALIAKSAANYATTPCDHRPQFRASRRRIAIW